MTPLLRLVLADLVEHTRIWSGITVIAAATAAVLSIAASDIASAAHAGGAVGLALYAIGGLVLMTTTVAAVVVLAAAADLTVVLQQRNYALWQLVGVDPRSVRRVVTAQLLVVAVVGAVVGAALTRPLLPHLFRVVFPGNEAFGAVDVRYGPVSAVAVVAFVGVVVLLSGGRSAERAGRVNGLAVLRDPEPPQTRMNPLRWAAVAALLAVLVAVLASLGGRPAAALEPPLLLVGMLVASITVSLGPVLYPAVLGLWTRVVPPTLSSSWFLARSTALHRTGRSSAVISPLLVAAALAGSLYAANGVVVAGDADDGTATVSLAAVVLLVGGPVLLSVVGAAVTVVMASGSRDREAALVRASGGTDGLVLAAAVGEAFIQVVTAALLSLVPVTATAVAGLVAAPPPVPGAALLAGLGSAAVTAGLEFSVLVPATLVPALLGIRRPITRVLATE